MRYKLRDLQLVGRYFGGDVEFDNIEEVRQSLIDVVEFDLEEDCSKLPTWELLEVAGYALELIGGGEEIEEAI